MYNLGLAIAGRISGRGDIQSQRPKTSVLPNKIAQSKEAIRGRASKVDSKQAFCLSGKKMI